MPNDKPHERYAAHLRTPSPNNVPDAGLRGLGHYERRLPRWRFLLRQKLIPLVRAETPYLAQMQETLRSPTLDSYFAITANLGTHTFYMMALPVCFWCGYPEIGLALVHMLAMGVYFSGIVKDFVCLPRPLSPPLQRITMSGSAALEYGFPSTHTTNAMSVGLYALYHITSSRESYSTTVYYLLCAACCWNTVSIALGRLYCGMHGFFDVVIGGILGAFIAGIRLAYGPAFDNWIFSGEWTRAAIVVLILAIAVRVHPEPADNCPCFDDSVSFIGVVMGAAIAVWHHATITDAAEELADLYPFGNRNPVKVVARIVIGVLIVFAWREFTKPILLRCLPPIFRFVDHWGLMIPRRYFLQARDYKTVPTLRKDDNVIPTASEIPGLMSNLRHPRKRTVSVGPQSEADAREFIANREQKRRDSRSSSSPHGKPSMRSQHSGDVLDSVALQEASTDTDQSSRPLLQVHPVDPHLLTPPPSDAGASSDSGREDEKNDREMFSGLEKPRIRYDAEVITRLVVYAGIGWWAIEGNPLLFKGVGLD